MKKNNANKKLKRIKAESTENTENRGGTSEINIKTEGSLEAKENKKKIQLKCKL